jgi:hypothetical protein
MMMMKDVIMKNGDLKQPDKKKSLNEINGKPNGT